MKMMPAPSDRQSTELSEEQKRELEATYYSMIRKITSLTINEAILIEQLRAIINNGPVSPVFMDLQRFYTSSVTNTETNVDQTNSSPRKKFIKSCIEEHIIKLKEQIATNKKPHANSTAHFADGTTERVNGELQLPNPITYTDDKTRSASDKAQPANDKMIRRRSTSSFSSIFTNKITIIRWVCFDMSANDFIKALIDHKFSKAHKCLFNAEIADTARLYRTEDAVAKASPRNEDYMRNLFRSGLLHILAEIEITIHSDLNNNEDNVPLSSFKTVVSSASNHASATTAQLLDIKILKCRVGCNNFKCGGITLKALEKDCETDHKLYSPLFRRILLSLLINETRYERNEDIKPENLPIELPPPSNSPKDKSKDGDRCCVM